jgi:acyl-CoA thioesterase YciA
VLRRRKTQPILVTNGNFTYVSIDDNGRPQVIRQDGASIPT